MKKLKYIKLVDKEIENSLSLLRDYEYLYTMARYHFNKKGSRFIPKLCFHMSNMLDIPHSISSKIASTIELFHNFTLIHDDIIDEDIYRRGQKSMWKKHGIPLAIISGNSIFKLVNKNIFDMFNNLYNHNILIQLINYFFKYVNTVFEGECYDIIYRDRVNIPIDKCVKINKMKSASTVQACCFFISKLKNAKVNNDLLDRFALNIGIALQLKNDIMDFRVLKDSSRKNFSLVNRKHSFPIVYANSLNKNIASFLKNDKLPEIIDFLQKHNIYEKSLLFASKYKNRGLSYVYKVFKKESKHFDSFLNDLYNDFDMGDFIIPYTNIKRVNK